MVFDDLYPYIKPHAHGVPGLVVDHNLRAAAIELCRKALIWKEYQFPVNTIGGTTAYAYAPEPEQQVVKLISMTVDGLDVPVVSPEDGRDRDRRGNLGPYAYGTFAGFELRPAPADALSIITFAAIAPGLAVTELPDSFARYAEALAHGALLRILSEPKKDWSNPGLAGVYEKMWDIDIGTARNDATSGNARTVQRTAPARF